MVKPARSSRGHPINIKMPIPAKMIKRKLLEIHFGLRNFLVARKLSLPKA